MKSETSTSALPSETREEQIARITAVMSQDEEYIASHLARPAPETREEQCPKCGRKMHPRVACKPPRVRSGAKQRLTETKCLGCGGTGIRPELGGLDIECHACNGTGKAV